MHPPTRLHLSQPTPRPEKPELSFTPPPSHPPWSPPPPLTCRDPTPVLLSQLSLSARVPRSLPPSSAYISCQVLQPPNAPLVKPTLSLPETPASPPSECSESLQPSSRTSAVLHAATVGTCLCSPTSSSAQAIRVSASNAARGLQLTASVREEDQAGRRGGS